MNNRKAGYKVLSLGVVGVLSWLDCTPVAQMQPNIPNGGRAVAVSVHPTNVSHIIVASETGGLFKSTDGGASWTQVSGTTTFGYSDVLYLPTDPNVVIAAAQADMRVTSSGGVWRSTDEGVTWSKGGITPPTAACTNNLAAFALVVGPATAVALPRLRGRGVWLLAGAALVAVALADVSGLSKAEVERIWLPFAPWLLIAAGGLPRRWLAAQVVLGLALQAGVRSPW